jgi:hypothetical protein
VRIEGVRIEGLWIEGAWTKGVWDRGRCRLRACDAYTVHHVRLQACIGYEAAKP